MKEAYCSFEIAKLLKEKGFNWSTQYVYTLDGTGSTPPKIGNWKAKSNIQKPTHQMACAWLREVHNILIIPRWVYDNNNSSVVYGYTIFKVFPLPYKDYSNEPIWYIEYNDAIGAALKYCLENLI